MRRKCSEKREKAKKKHKHRLNDRILEDDFRTLELLHEQIVSLMIFFISDCFFYRYGNYIIYEILSGDKNEEELFFYTSINFIKANVFAVIAAAAGLQINIIRFKEQLRKKYEGKIHYSLNPERKNIFSSTLLLLLFLFQLAGSIGLYKRNVIHTDGNTEEWLRLYGIEIRAFEIRYIADYLLLQSTMMSIELIKSKYDERKDMVHNESDNPDIPAIIAGQLYVIQRSMLLYTNYNIYREIRSKYNSEVILQPNIQLVIGNILGVAGTLITLNAFYDIYSRNLGQPTFGR